MGKSLGRILIVDDDPGVLQTAKFTLKQHFQRVVTDKDPRKIPYYLNEDLPDVILLDMNFKPGIVSGDEGLKWLKQIEQHSPSPSVIMITAYGEVNIAVEAMKHGAVDFVVKPWENEKFVATVKAAHKLNATRREVEKLKVINRQLVDLDINFPIARAIGWGVRV